MFEQIFTQIETILKSNPEWGYLILFAWTFVEGETILIIAGFLASQGYLDVRLAILSAFVGSMTGDQCVFLLGRFKGPWLLKKFERRRAAVDRVLHILERNAVWLLLSFRFFYGLRNVTSIAVGVSHVPAKLFVCLNAIGAFVWALSFALGGYYFGKVFTDYIDDLHTWMAEILGGLVCLLLLVGLYRRVQARRAAAREAKQAATSSEPAGPAAHDAQAAQPVPTPTATVAGDTLRVPEKDSR